MTKLRPWLVPTLVGPFATLWTLTTLLIVLAGHVRLLGERLDGWALAMFLTGFIAAGQVVSLLIADVALLALRLRRLPLGGRAWASSLVCPLFLYGATMFTPPLESVALLVAWLGACFLGSAAAARLLFGTRPLG
jgi:hypothetical protein